MAQFARAVADSIDGGWTDQIGTTALSVAIDEVSPSDADYIKSSEDPVNDAARVKLTSLSDPNVGTGHILRYRINKFGIGILDVIVRLIQGPSTVIAEWQHIAFAGGVNPTTFAQALTTPQADSITDYTNLFFEIVADLDTGTSGSLDTAIQSTLWWINQGD